MIDCINYVITHKPYPLAIHNVDMYQRLCVGEYREEGELTDQYGTSISKYNDRLNELTGLFWIWQNGHSDYVGLSHYRRYFMHNEKIIKRKDVEEILCNQGYDIIVPTKTTITWAESVEQNIIKAVGWHLENEAHLEFCYWMEQYCPDYLYAFNKIMEGNTLRPCNMFITSDDIMYEYCEWLFPFLLRATDEIDVSAYNGNQRRVAGYFGEVMFNVWLEKQNLNMCEKQIIARK